MGNTKDQALGTGEKERKDEATALWKEDFVMPSQPKGNKEIQSYNDRSAHVLKTRCVAFHGTPGIF